MKLVLILVLISTLAIWDVAGLSCPPCNRDDCPATPTCNWGVGTDPCACCNICLKGPGEVCGGPWYVEGHCGEGLQCVKDESKHAPGILDQAMGECQPATKKPLQFTTS
ncbi:Insulin-like growth factor-binding protein IGFBP [Trinorchestia longiramus]|nr:Insulin-like growth factor-binding protein IGFBP [Trinorchestia longiramus]